MRVPLGDSRASWVALALMCSTGCFLDRSFSTPQGCANDGDCPGGTCVDGQCRPAPMDAGEDGGSDGGRDAGTDAGIDGGSTCANGMLDVGEVDVDCGGPCPRCTGPIGVEAMLLWLRADDVPASGFVTWTDRSGNGHGFEPILGAPSPTVVSGVVAIRDQPAIDFAQAARIASSAPIAMGGGAQLSVVYVMRSRTPSGIVLESSENFRDVDGAFLDLCNNNKFDSQHGRPPTIVEWQSTPMDLGWHWIASVRDLSRSSGEIQVFVDGASSGAPTMNGDVTPPLSDRVWYLGGRQGTPSYPGLDGEIAEVIAYRRVLDASDVAHLGAYVHERYGL